MSIKPSFVLLAVFLAMALPACRGSERPLPPLTQEEQLLVDVFDPQPGESVLVMVDVPGSGVPDNQAWQERREMADEWQAMFSELASFLDFNVQPLLTYEATGGPNSPLPESGIQDGVEINLEETIAASNIVVALTEFSATAPLIELTEQYPDLRAASMPMVMRRMEETALAADYSEIARKSEILADKLDAAVGAEVYFSSGHEMYFDLRYRSAHADDGQLHKDKEGMRVINLPSGEAYIAPYEGERSGEPSMTEGMLPVQCEVDDVAVGRVVENRIVEVQGDGPCAAEGQQILEVDPAMTNVAEFGLGVNEKAVATGNVLEDEKVVGMHFAIGLSEHIGGTLGPDDFQDPANAVHRDFVYPKDGPIEISSLILIYQDGSSEQIILEGDYVIF